MLTYFKKSDFRGRASEAEFWRWAILPFFVLLPLVEYLFLWFGFEYIEDFKFSALKSKGMSGVFCFFALPALATTVRRLHDGGYTASLFLAPFAISAAALIHCGDNPFVWSGAWCVLAVSGILVFGNCIAEGDPETNRFGPPPTAWKRWISKEWEE